MAIDQSFQPACCNRKVKLLCSFGGKFLHRPYDWTLRYAGGHSRIITVPRDTTLPQLCRKLSHVFGAPVAIRYQLPKQEIDNLVSVYSVEDLEYMMEEFDKLTQPSAKLHVFLFTQSEIASMLAPSELTLIDLCDGGQEYFEAVKSTFSASHAADIYSCQIRSPKDTHNSDDSIPSSPAKGNLDPLSEEYQVGGSFAHPLSHPNTKKAFHLPLCQIPPLQPWLLPPPTIKPYELQPLPSDNNHMDCNLGSISEDTQASYGLFIMMDEDRIVVEDSLETMENQESLQVCLLHGEDLHEDEDDVVMFKQEKEGGSARFFADDDSHGHLKVTKVKFFGYEDVDLVGTRLSGLYTFYGYTTMGKNEMKMEIMDSHRYVDGILFMAGQEGVWKCWKDVATLESNTDAAEFRCHDGVPLAGVFNKGVDHEEESFGRQQHVLFPELMSCGSEESYLLMIVFEMDGASYLSCILQNYIFDPGGSVASALMKQGLRCSLKAKD